MRLRNNVRAAFTIVELLVATALIVFIMAILASVFASGTETFRNLKAIGDMADQLRASEVVIRRDLQADHFLEEDTKTNMGRRVSDQRTDLGAVPRGGFFRIRSMQGISENFDEVGIESTRADGTTGNLLHFTSVLPGGTDQNIYTATVGGITANSRAAEIVYFLDPVATGSTGTLPTYNLNRRVRLVAMDAASQTVLNALPVSDPSVISISTGVNLMTDLVNPALGRRLGGNGAVATALAATFPPTMGDDVLLSQVLSFEVKVLWSDAINPSLPGARAFYMPTPPAPPNTPQNTDFPFDTLQQGRGNPEFDTGNNPGIRVKALQIRLRIWDTKTKTARQITIVQDM